MTLCVKPDTARQPIYPQDDSLPSPRLPEDDEEEFEQFAMWSRQRSDSVGKGLFLLNSVFFEKEFRLAIGEAGS